MGDARACNDCGALPGEPHESGCDVARCPACGIQRIQCGEHRDADLVAIWTGRWPGLAECEREDWWCYFVPYEGFIPCSADHPKAVHDLNRLVSEAGNGRLVWDPTSQEFVRPWPCSSEDCPNLAAYAVTFRGQAGHVHDCVPHTAQLREWTDVESVVSLPCPHPHGDGTRWVDTPRPLEEQTGTTEGGDT